MKADLRRPLSHYQRYEAPAGITGTIQNDADAWFTFMQRSYVDPANNWTVRRFAKW